MCAVFPRLRLKRRRNREPLDRIDQLILGSDQEVAAIIVDQLRTVAAGLASEWEETASLDAIGRARICESGADFIAKHFSSFSSSRPR